MSFDFDAWKGMMDATARPSQRQPLAFRAAASRLWAQALLRLGGLAAMAGLMAGLWIMAEGWAWSDPQRLLWGVLACLCAGVALWRSMAKRAMTDALLGGPSLRRALGPSTALQPRLLATVAGGQTQWGCA
ncbi:MAG: hypothetical protein AB1412_05370 [Pseudomonadota bacterium]